jgi:uncharacterized membrane protein
MAFCNKCGAQIEDGATFCPACGAPQNAAQAAPAPVADPSDHTAEYDPADISANKVKAMLCYLLGVGGVILAALTGTKSDYVDFHVREVLKITVLELLVCFAVAILCWTIIVPFAGFVCLAILYVVRIIGFFKVCKGQAKELPIVKAFKFLT